MDMNTRRKYQQRKQRDRILWIVIVVAVIVVVAAVIGVHSHKNKDNTDDSNPTKQTVQKDDKKQSLEESGASFAYQLAYPEMNVGEIPETVKPKGTVIYLTFDDGPSALTYEVLDILEQYKAKATFFVVGNNLTEERKPLLQRMLADGCTIGIHTDTHDYKTIYESVDAYLADFNSIYEKLHDMTGQYPEIFRFPGGSINGYNKGFYEPLIAEMLRRGFVYFDWNISSEDATGKAYTAEELCSNVVGKVDAFHESKPVVLFHDAGNKKTTVAALKLVLAQLSAKGYTFEALDRTSPEVSFSYKN